VNRMATGVLSVLLLACPPIAAAGKDLKNSEVLRLSIDDYVKLVLKQSDRSLVAYNQFQNSTISRQTTLRRLMAPSLGVSAGATKSKSDIDDVDTVTEDADGSATLSQPLFLSGGRLSATYSNSITRTEEADGSVTHDYIRPSLSASLSQPLFVFVSNPDLRTWNRSVLSYDIAKDNYQRELQRIENDARSRYYNLLLKSAQLDVERVKWQSSQRANDITKALVEGGRLPGIELSRSDLRYQQDVRRLKNAETALQQAINDALEFASLKIDSDIELTSKLDYRPLSLDLEKLIEHALKHRPDYIAAKRQLELNELSVRETLEENNPRLSASASVSRSESGDGEPPDTESESWSGGLTLSWPIFDSGITRLRADAARNDLENQRVNLRGLERSIRKEVTNALLDLQRTEAQLDDLEKSKLQARRSVEAVRIRYQNGRDKLLDVFDSEQQLRDLELEYLNAVISANLVRDRLALLIGSPLTEVAR
jgi:outer membrane protein